MNTKTVIRLFNRLWQQYTDNNPHVGKIHRLFTDQGETVINDHVAFRTIDDLRVDIDVLAAPFIEAGYFANGDYVFEQKKLFAKHFEHEDPTLPKVFISKLLVDEFSPFVKDTLTKAIDQIDRALLADPAGLISSGASWSKPDYQTYQRLLVESEYAAWFYVFGFCANHFTVFINALKSFHEVQEINDFLKFHGYPLNDAGGEIKGTPAELLEQSSTKSGTIEVEFTQGRYSIPSCYYEFAKRYTDKNGKLYQGFVATSADKIFESTDVK
ncbi:MAG: DUF1338 domain-containing protein [Francisellaceae bacterium]